MTPRFSLEKRGSVADDAPTYNERPLGALDVDAAAELAAGNDFVLDPEEAARVRCLCCACCYPDPGRLTTAWAQKKN